MKPVGISTIARRTVISIAVASAFLAAGTAPSRSAPFQQQGEFNYTVMFSDEQGVSHFKDEHVAWNAQMEGKIIWFRHFAPGLKLDWHNERPLEGTTKRWVIIVSGAMEIETSDRAKRTFNPGSVFLAMDREGQGHRNAVIGDQELVLAFIDVP